VPSAPASAKKSRFKKARDAEAGADDDEPPIGPAGMVIAEKLMERTTPNRRATAPSEDEPDEIMQRRELAAEYYRRRNDIIRQQGGFKGTPDEDDAEGELMEERDGKMKKVSRFRAARIKM
jgi:unconventional prefoldin RPB5 interactor 1